MQHAILYGQLRHWTIDIGTGEPVRKDLVTLPVVLNELAAEGWDVYWILNGSGGEHTVFLRRPVGQ